MPSLAEIIAAEADMVSAFVALLREEQEILKSGTPDALPSVVERKTVLAARLNPQSQLRNRTLAAAGHATDRVGMEAWLKQHGDDAATRKAWTRLLDLAREAHELNRLNGELIRVRQQHAAEALDALLPGLRQDIYGASGGQGTPTTTRRIIDSA